MSLGKEIHDTLILFYYGISPSWALAVVVTFVFACASLVHLILLFVKRSWFMIPLNIGALFELLGYGFRATGLHEEPPSSSTYVTSTTFLVIAPAFIVASLYQLLAHILIADGRGGPSRTLKLGLGLCFGAFDSLAYALQAAGAAKLKQGPWAAKDQNAQALSSLLSSTRSLLLAGNVLNVLTLILFLTLTTYAFSATRSSSPPGFRRLYVCLTLLFVRTIYRITAYSRGLSDLQNHNPKQWGLRIEPLFHEPWMYGFDALFIFIILVDLGAWYPDRRSLDEKDPSSSLSSPLSPLNLNIESFTGQNGPQSLLSSLSLSWLFGKKKKKGEDERVSRANRARGSNNLRMDVFSAA